MGFNGPCCNQSGLRRRAGPDDHAGAGLARRNPSVNAPVDPAVTPTPPETPVAPQSRRNPLRIKRTVQPLIRNSSLQVRLIQATSSTRGNAAMHARRRWLKAISARRFAPWLSATPSRSGRPQPPFSARQAPSALLADAERSRGRQLRRHNRRLMRRLVGGFKCFEG